MHLSPHEQYIGIHVTVVHSDICFSSSHLSLTESVMGCYISSVRHVKHKRNSGMCSLRLEIFLFFQFVLNSFIGIWALWCFAHETSHSLFWLILCRTYRNDPFFNLKMVIWTRLFPWERILMSPSSHKCFTDIQLLLLFSGFLLYIQLLLSHDSVRNFHIAPYALRTLLQVINGAIATGSQGSFSSVENCGWL